MKDEMKYVDESEVIVWDGKKMVGVSTASRVVGSSRETLTTNVAEGKYEHYVDSGDIVRVENSERNKKLLRRQSVKVVRRSNNETLMVLYSLYALRDLQKKYQGNKYNSYGTSFVNWVPINGSYYTTLSVASKLLKVGHSHLHNAVNDLYDEGKTEGILKLKGTKKNFKFLFIFIKGIHRLKEEEGEKYTLVSRDLLLREFGFTPDIEYFNNEKMKTNLEEETSESPVTTQDELPEKNLEKVSSSESTLESQVRELVNKEVDSKLQPYKGKIVELEKDNKTYALKVQELEQELQKEKENVEETKDVTISYMLDAIKGKHEELYEEVKGISAKKIVSSIFKMDRNGNLNRVGKQSQEDNH